MPLGSFSNRFGSVTPLPSPDAVLSSARAAVAAAYGMLPEVQREWALPEDPGYDYGSVLPFAKSKETGDTSLAMPKMLRRFPTPQGALAGLGDIAKGVYHMGESGVTAPMDAYTGKLPMTETIQTGDGPLEIDNPEVLNRAWDVALTAPLGGVATPMAEAAATKSAAMGSFEPKGGLLHYAPPLKGLPKESEIPGQGMVPVGPHGPARDAAINYMERTGREYDPPTEYVPIDRPKAEKVASEFERMKHDPQNPEVAASYDALINESLDQFQDVKASGLKIDFIEKGMKDPYEASPRLAHQDVIKNNHLWVYPTDSGFGTDAAFDASQNQLLRMTDETVNGRQLRANDVFRIVHDYFGHIKEGVGFRAKGEDNAFRGHRAMFSPLARKALATETRGQNSWLNFGPYGTKNRTAKSADTVFADQKIGILPDWAINYANPKEAAAVSALGSFGEKGTKPVGDFPFDNPNAKNVGAPIEDTMSSTGKLYGEPTVTGFDPKDIARPGLYDDPRKIIEMVETAPESVWLKKLFGVTREDLYNISQGGTRKGNMSPVLQFPARGPGKNVTNLMTDANAQRMIDVLAEAGKRPDIYKGMDAWYVQDPLFWKFVDEFGLERGVKEFQEYNMFTAAHSPGTPVDKEITRGTISRMLHKQGRGEEWLDYGGQPGADYSSIKNIVRNSADAGHMYHGNMAGPSSMLAGLIREGEFRPKPEAMKVNVYEMASGVPETGFQTSIAVPDSHYSRGTGRPDVMPGLATRDANMRTNEGAPFTKWFRDKVAEPLGIESVPAQGRMWGALSKITGVKTAIGKTKLEILVDNILRRATETGKKPEDILRGVVRGTEFAANPREAIALSLLAAQQRGAQH